MSYTKGPWKVSSGNAVKAGNKNICSHVNAAARDVVNMVQEIEISKANARLISAAPDLLEALHKFASIKIDCASEIVPNGYSNPEEWRSDVEAARAAISKALGK